MKKPATLINMLIYEIFHVHTLLLNVGRQNKEPIFVLYTALGLIGIFYLIFIVRLWKLWQKQMPVLRRVSWSIVLLIPLFGPIFYGAWFRPPSVQPEDQRARGRYYGGGL